MDFYSDSESQLLEEDEEEDGDDGVYSPVELIQHGTQRHKDIIKKR